MLGLMEDSWILISIFAFNLFSYVVFVDVCEENLSSPKYVSGKGKCIFIAFQVIVDIFL